MQPPTTSLRELCRLCVGVGELLLPAAILCLNPANSNPTSCRPPLPPSPTPFTSHQQLDYYLALNAAKFIGNSVSTFTAYAALERHWLRRWAGACWVGRAGGVDGGGVGGWVGAPLAPPSPCTDGLRPVDTEESSAGESSGMLAVVGA